MRNGKQKCLAMVVVGLLGIRPFKRRALFLQPIRRRLVARLATGPREGVCRLGGLLLLLVVVVLCGMVKYLVVETLECL